MFYFQRLPNFACSPITIGTNTWQRSLPRCRVCRARIMSLSFLFCKPWHPATTWNQKKIWEAEQRDDKRKRDEATAKKELERESDRRRYEQMAVGKKEPDPTSASLNFMYAPPPGFQQPQEKELDDDDEAVKKFKALAKLKSDPNFSAAASCSELEKLVGRRKNPGVSLAEQQERFPFLKDAPVEHAYAADVKVNFKPFNNVVRHVKCMRCGEWGHRSGDRECKLINENPNDKDRRRWEDPMSYLEESAPAGEVATGSAVGQGLAEEDSDAAFLSTLSSKKKRRLLRLLQDMEVGGRDRSGEGGRKGERKRKRERKSSGSGDKEKKGDGRHSDGERRESMRDSHGERDEGAERREGRSRLGDEAQEKDTKRRAVSLSDDECGSDRGGRRGRREGKRSKRSRRTDGERRSGESSRKRSSRSDRDRDGTGRRGSEKSHDSRSKDRGAKGDSGERRKR